MTNYEFDNIAYITDENNDNIQGNLIKGMIYGLLFSLPIWAIIITSIISIF